MITYNKETEQFQSNTKAHDLEDVTEIIMYQWLKNNEVTLGTFKQWCLLNKIKMYHKGINDCDELYKKKLLKA